MPQKYEIKVLKFGGTSVKNPQRLIHVAQIIASENKYKRIVVVSAMGQTTDNLVQLAARCSDNPNPRELDVLLASGEQQAIALLSIVLSDLGVRARSFTGHQLGIMTEANYGSAEILSINSEKIRAAFEEYDVIVVAGFQGVTINGDITTLGRGGSDTSAVALAAASETKLCEIYTDVDGIFTTDPNIISQAIQHREISYEDCLHMAAQGAQVIHPRAVECARENDIPLIVRSVFNPANKGTVICNIPRQAEGCSNQLAGITASNGFAVLTVASCSDEPKATALYNLVKASVGALNLHHSSRRLGHEYTHSYLISGINVAGAEKLIETLQGQSGITEARIRLNITRFSIIGNGSSSLDLEALPPEIGAKFVFKELLRNPDANCVSFYVEQEVSLEVWQALHEHFRWRFEKSSAPIHNNTGSSIPPVLSLCLVTNDLDLTV